MTNACAKTKPRSFKQRRGSLAPYVTGFHTRLPNLRQRADYGAKKERCKGLDIW